MDYEAFKATFLRSLAASRIPTIGSERVHETLDARSLDRICVVYVEGPDRGDAGPFHVSGEVSWRWRSIHTARTATTEEDLLSELLGRVDLDEVETKLPWLRVDVKLRASVQPTQALAMPPSAIWARWGRDVAEQFNDRMRLVPADNDGRLEILGWQGEPKLTVECTEMGELRLRAIELPAFQLLELPRRWDDPDRESDEDPGLALNAMFKRVSRGLAAWRDLALHLAG
jgi:hypothetical protein